MERRIYSADITEDLHSDLVLLDEVTEESATTMLQTRYKKDQIYTAIGPVLIAVNPYKLIHVGDGPKKVSWYSADVMKEYQGRQIHEVKPHPFAIAEDAYRHMISYGANNCIIITGESGAGKTETSKQIMSYLSEMSLQTAKKHEAEEAAKAGKAKGGRGRSSSVADCDHVKQMLLASNPTLEAFGNAQTLRNYNSSRFGKYMVLQFDYKQEMNGGYITNYLLEKGRVTEQQPGERNFHIFYQLLAGCADAERAELRLPAGVGATLKHVSCTVEAPPGVDDKADFEEVCGSMDAMSIGGGKRASVMRALAAILWAGNLSISGGDGDSAKVAEDEALANVAHLLGVDAPIVMRALTSRSISVGGSRASVHVVALDAKQAGVTRDSMCKAIYSKTFDWLVAQINAILNKEERGTKTIGLLDIYGFEIFETNSFEQLCINYVNEKLQQVFINLTLKAEQDEYDSEGIVWTPVEFFNNQVVCELIEGKPNGVLNLLDEQCSLAEPSDESLLQKYHQQLESNANYSKPRFTGTSSRGDFAGTFGIKHYAGEVEYSALNFVDKNKDTLFNDVRNMFLASDLPFLVDLFEDTRPEHLRKKRPPTMATMFKASVNTLVDALTKCNPHYIRTIKPNETKRPGDFDVERCTHQVRYLGLLENIRIRRAGFCFRVTMEKFLGRFKMLCPETWPVASGAADVEKLLTHKTGCYIDINGVRDYFVRGFDSGLGAYEIGKTKVFIRQPKALFALERLRAEALPRIASLIQASVRKCLFRMKITKMHALHEVMVSTTDEYISHLGERQARSSAEVRGATPEMEARWAMLGAQFPVNSSFQRKLEARKQAMHASFVNAHGRALKQHAVFSKTKKAAITFQAAYKGLVRRRDMDPATWERCHRAVLTLRAVFERYMGQKLRRRASFDVARMGDYLTPPCAEDPNVQKVLEKLKAGGGSGTVLFASDVMKVNIGKIKQERVLLITETHVLNLDGGKSRKEKRAFEIRNIMSLEMSKLADNFLVFHVKDDHDLCVICDQKTEAANVLRKQHERITGKGGTPLSVLFSNKVSVTERKSMFHGAVHTLTFVPGSDPSGTIYTKNKAEKDSLTISVHDTSDLVPWGANPREGGAGKRLSTVVDSHTGKR